MTQSTITILPEGGLTCTTCHDWHPTEDHIGTFGRLVAECSECRRVRKLKENVRNG